MCIGVPMQVIEIGPGHARCAGRGEMRRVRTALVGDVTPGEWLLVFIDSAQERLDVLRADEINATLDLLQSALAGDAADRSDDTPLAFDLPSRWTMQQLRELSGATPTNRTESVS